MAFASPGAIWTTLQGGERVDANIYESKPLVYLNGGPKGNGGGIPDGSYYYMVTDPSGAVLLSQDAIECRQVQVVGGRIAGSIGPGCKHANGSPRDNGSTAVQLIPFADTPNSGGEYKAWLTPTSQYNPNGCKFGFCGGASKTDNFKVMKPLPAQVVACKFNDLDGNGALDTGETIIAGWPITATGVSGGTVTTQTGDNGCVSFTVDNPGSGLVTVSEGTLGDQWTQTAPTPGPHSRAGNSPAYTVTNGVASTNDLQSGDIFTVDFGNNNPNCTEAHPCNPPTCLTQPTPDCIALLVSKTASPSYRVTWTLDKVGNTDPIYTNADGDATAHYTVTAHATPTDFAISGEITVANETVIDADSIFVTDVLGGGWLCTVAGGSGVDNQGLFIPAGSSITLQYTCGNGSLTVPPVDPLTNTATATWSAGFATGSVANINFGTATVVDGTINVTDPKAPGDHLLTYSPANGSDYSFSYDATWTGSAGTCVDKVNTATLTSQTPNSVLTVPPATATVKVCSASNPTVSKTADTTFKRTYNWKIEKSVDATQKNISGGSATFNYTVKATQLASTDSDWKVTGTITVTNSNDFEDISVNVADALPVTGTPSCTVDSTTLTVPKRTEAGNGTASTNYSCTYTTAPPASPFNNTGTATWTAATYHTPAGSASGTAPVTFGTPTTTVNKVITVKDVFNGGSPATLGTATATDPPADPTVKTFDTYQQTVSGTAGTCTSYPNTATFTSDDSSLTGSADVTVKVCQGADLTVSKTATPTFKRSYTWGITKTVDNTSLKTNGPDVTFNYTVTATQTGQQDSNWQVTGTITVTNPNDWETVSVNLSDAIGSTGVCLVNGSATATITVPKKTEAGNGTATASYTCTYATQPATDFTNTVTAGWTGASTPGTSATGTATGNFLSPTSVLNKTINVTDVFNSLPADALFTVTATDPPAAAASNFKTYSHSVNTAAGTCKSFTNVASFASTETTPLTGSATKTVEVCRGANLTVNKTVNTTYARTYNWTLGKSADKTHVEFGAGGNATFTYTLTATETGFTDTNVGASGTITVTNPNTWQDVSVSLIDAIQGGPSCTITEGATVTVLRSASVTLHYTCAPTSVTNFTNEVTANWNGSAAYTPDSSAMNTAAGTFGAPASTTNATVGIMDNWNGAGLVGVGTPIAAVDSGLPKATQFQYQKTVTGVAGKCTSYTNNAVLLAGATTLANAAATVEACVGSGLTIDRTMGASYQRVYAWTIDKSVDRTLLIAGGTANYSVTVTQTSAQAGNFLVSGTITVTNPNNWEAITFDLSDGNDIGGVCGIAGGGTGITLAAGGSVVKAFNCSFSTVPNLSFINQWTVAVTSGVVPSPTVTGTIAGSFLLTGITNQTVTVNDTMGGILGTVTGTDGAPFATHTYNYARFIAAPGSGCAVVNNTATIIETGASDTVQVSACNIAGHTIGFWQNPNGQRIIDNADQVALGNWLRQFAPFADAPNTGTPGAIGNWFDTMFNTKSCGGSSCNTMLRTQMAGTAFAVYFTDPALGGNLLNQPVPIGGALISLLNPENVSAAFGATSMTIMDMLLHQNLVSNANGTVWYSQNKGLQVLAKDAFDNINNGKIFGP